MNENQKQKVEKVKSLVRQILDLEAELIATLSDEDALAPMDAAVPPKIKKKVKKAKKAKEESEPEPRAEEETPAVTSKKKYDVEKIKQAIRDGRKVPDIAEEFGLSQPTIYTIKKKMKQDGDEPAVDVDEAVASGALEEVQYNSVKECKHKEMNVREIADDLDLDVREVGMAFNSHSYQGYLMLR